MTTRVQHRMKVVGVNRHGRWVEPANDETRAEWVEDLAKIDLMDPTDNAKTVEAYVDLEDAKHFRLDTDVIVTLEIG